MSSTKSPAASKGMSRLAKLVSSAGRSPAPAAEKPPPPVPRPAVTAGRDPRLSAFVSKTAFNAPSVGAQEVLRALGEAVRSKDKNARQALVGLLLRLFFFEELPPEAMQLVVPLFQAQGKDVRTLRSLYYLAQAHVGSGAAGTPTLFDPALAGKRPDDGALQAVLGEAWRLLQAPELDPAVARATFYLAAAAARGSAAARKQLAAQVQAAISAADEQAAVAGPPGRSPRRSAATDWDLQHTAFATTRLAGMATGADEISRSFGVGLGSGDAVGARHALALGVGVAYRDPGYAVREAYQAVAEAAQQYEASGPGPPAAAGQGINLDDAFGRLHLARLCAAVVHSDQSATDVSRDGAPFWRMLCLLATRDPSDMVRFGAIEAMAGVPASAGASLSAPKPGSSAREDTVARQRRGRAWRLLVSQAAAPVSVPGAGDKAAAMKLVDVLGRLLVAALRKAAAAPARFCVAAGAVAALAESCVASQASGTARHGSSADVDRVLGVVAAELGALVEAGLPAAARCAVIEALLYLQAAGYATAFTPAKLAQAGGGGGGAWTGGMQDALLAAVLKCAKAKPRQAAAFLGYATAVVGIAPSGLDLSKITDLWDAAVAAGREGRAAALAAAMGALAAAPPPAAQARPGAPAAEVTRAAREEDGWNAFVSTAAWWLGEHANALCDEFCGRKLTPSSLPASLAQAAPPPAAGDEAAAAGSEAGSAAGDASDDDHAGAAAASAAAATEAELLAAFGGRSPALSRIVLALQGLMLTAAWQLRLAAAQALAKIAVRSGEPYRLQVYSLLAAAGGAGGAGGGDALGVQSATRPALALLDRLYAAQAVLEGLWAEHGDDVAAWPKDVVASLGRRNAELARQAERYVCAVPRDRYSLLGHRAALALAADVESGDSYSAFLQKTGSEAQEAAPSDRVGEQLAASKNREVDAILGSHASDDAGSLSFKPVGASEASPTLDDRNKEIDRLLMGGGSLSGAASEPWGFAAGFNAFAEGGEAAAPDAAPDAFALSPGGGASADATPRFGAGSPGGARAASPAAGATDGAGWFGDAGGGGGASAQAIGTGTVLHTFVGDYNQPEELSVFEGDKVQVLEEADGWMLVRDPGGREGLVPTAYLRVDTLYQQTLQSAAAAQAAAAAAEYQRKGAGTPTRAHRRGASVDWGQASKEDQLDSIFSSYTANPMPPMPEEQPASFGGAFLGGGASSSAGEGGRDGTGGSLSPVPRQDSFTGATGRTDSMWASQPLRQESLARSTDPYSDGGAAGASPRGGLGRQASSAASGASPRHRRTPSGGTSHRRTTSGASSGGGWGAPADGAEPGSMPNTPSRVEGPERPIVAGFVGELEGELSVEAGERVKVHSEVDGWARVIRLSDNRTGLVPSWAVGGGD